MSRFEEQHGEGYITADIESPLAKVKMDIHQIPFGENHFDVVLCNHVLEHVADDIKAISEIQRVFKAEGCRILLVPVFSIVPDITFEDNSIVNKREREKVFCQDDHVRKFGKDYRQRIERAGLKAVADPFAASLPAETIKKYGLSKEELIYKGIK